MGTEGYSANEKPISQIEYEGWLVELCGDLEVITPSEFNEAEKKAKEFIADEDIDIQRRDKYSDTLKVLQYLSRMQAIQNKEEFLSTLVKDPVKIVLINNVVDYALGASLTGDYRFNNAIYHLQQTIKNLSNFIIGDTK